MPSPLQKYLDQRHASGSISRERLPFAEQIASERRIRKANYQEDLETAGQIEDLADFLAYDKRRSQTRMMSIAQADRMERTGEKGYHNGKSMSFVGLNSATVDEIEPFRRNNAIPQVAQEKREKLLKELTYFVEKETEKVGVKFRHWIQHDGPRCLACRLPKRWQAQNGRVTNFNESPIARRLDAQVVMRSNEAGSPVKKEKNKVQTESGKWHRPYVLDDKGKRVRVLDEKGRQTYHPHTHMIVRLGRYLTDSEFSELIEFAQRHFKTPKLDSGALHNTREACKYVIKCDELADVKDIDFRRYLKATFKRRLIAFYGDLKLQIKIHKHNGQHIKAIWDPKEKKSIYRVRRNPNARVIKASKTKNQEIFDKLTMVDRLEETEWEKADRRSDDCQIVAKLAPIPLALPIREPVLLCRGAVDTRELLGRPEVIEILKDTQDHFEAACGLFEMLHGCTPWEWVNGQQPPAQPQQSDLFEADSARIFADVKGSAHNAPVISKFHKPGEAPASGKRAASEVPIGPPEAVSEYEQSNLPVEKWPDYKKPEKPIKHGII